jgi:glycerol-3-phosphate dehydrogenase
MDIAHDGPADEVAVDHDEIEHLLKVLQRYFRVSPNQADVVQAFSGVRRLGPTSAAHAVSTGSAKT